MTGKWLKILLIWAAVLISAIWAFQTYSDDRLYTAYAAIAGAAIAVVSLGHLLSKEAKDTVRQQVYVSAGTVAILGVMTVIHLAS